MILDSAADSENERCSAPDWPRCPDAAEKLTVLPRGVKCPFLRESLMEYCAASPMTKYIPANDALLSRCRSEGHLYCDLYREMADGSAGSGDRGSGIESGGGDAAARDGGERDAQATVAGGAALERSSVDIAVPGHLGYAPNHMWLDVAEDGSCHIGVDAFLVWVVGAIDEVSFITPRDLDRPVAVLGVGGVDLQIAFPNALTTIVPNVNLRTNPSRVASDPYGSGWLFEGVDPVRSNGGKSMVRRGLLFGGPARDWIRLEIERIDHFVHDMVARPNAEGAQMMADGGTAAGALATRLDRQARLTLFHEFFAPQGVWR